MNVTIYTDASFQALTKLASFAYYCKSDNGVIKNHGQFKTSMIDVNHCELASIAKAIHNVYHDWKNIECIYLNTDNASCVDILDGTCKKIKLHYQQIIDIINKDLRSENKFPKLVVRHIKSHQKDKSDVRVWLNTWCDKNAGIYKKQNLKQ